ncbi:MAG: redoxin domain-containing protein [Planctomycetota bacterium]
MTAFQIILKTLQRIASMSFLSVRDVLSRAEADGRCYRRLMMVGLAGCGFLIAGCSDSEDPMASDGLGQHNSPMMIPAVTALPNPEASVSVSIGDQPPADLSHPRLSTPDAGMSPMRKSGFRQVESNFSLPSEPQLQVGDQAPELAVRQWIREREEPTIDQPRRIQVITFWATWSEPSVAAMERCPLLEKRFGERVEIIGVSLETPEAVHGFLNSSRPGSGHLWRDYLTFAIAADHLGETEEKFLLAGFEQGLPASFVIDQTGIVAWIGAADQCEPVVARILAGDWDIAAARKAHQWAQYRKSSQREIRDRLALARVSNDAEECLRLIDGLLEQFPSDVEFQMLRLRYQLRFEMADSANTQSAALLGQLRDDSLRLNQLAWILAEHSDVVGLDLSTALSAAQRAVGLTSGSDVSSLETLARVHFRRGETAAAIEALSMATKLEPSNQTLGDTLEAFRNSTASPVRKAGFHGSMM